MYFSFRPLRNRVKIPISSSCICVFLLSSICLSFANAQETEPKPEEGDKKAETTEEKKNTAGQDPLDVRVRRLYQKLESEFAFLLPEGEFDVTLEKKLGYWLADANAHYNFEIGRAHV